MCRAKRRRGIAICRRLTGTNGLDLVQNQNEPTTESVRVIFKDWWTLAILSYFYLSAARWCTSCLRLAFTCINLAMRRVPFHSQRKSPADVARRCTVLACQRYDRLQSAIGKRLRILICEGVLSFQVGIQECRADLWLDRMRLATPRASLVFY